MTGDLTINYAGKTTILKNAEITFPRRTSDLTRFTNEQLEEADELMKAAEERLLRDSVEEFWRQHPDGGTFLTLADGSVGFIDARTSEIAKLRAPKPPGVPNCETRPGDVHVTFRRRAPSVNPANSASCGASSGNSA